MYKWVYQKTKGIYKYFHNNMNSPISMCINSRMDHIIGILSHSNRTRKINLKLSRLERDEIITLCREHDNVYKKS